MARFLEGFPRFYLPVPYVLAFVVHAKASCEPNQNAYLLQTYKASICGMTE